MFENSVAMKPKNPCVPSSILGPVTVTAWDGVIAAESAAPPSGAISFVCLIFGKILFLCRLPDQRAKSVRVVCNIAQSRDLFLLSSHKVVQFQQLIRIQASDRNSLRHQSLFCRIFQKFHLVKGRK